MPYPDYGTPGAPNMDPYFVSPERERAAAEERAESISCTVDAYANDLRGVLLDLADSLKTYGAMIVSVTVEPATLGIKIEVKS